MLEVCNVATACHIGKFLYGCTLLCYTPVETRGLRITLARRWSDFVFMLTCSLKYVYIQQGDVVLCTVPIVSLHLRYIRKRPGLIGLDPLRKDFNLILPSGGTSLPSTSHLFLFGDCYPVEKTVPLAQVIATRMTEMLLRKKKVNSIYGHLALYILNYKARSVSQPFLICYPKSNLDVKSLPPTLPQSRTNNKIL